MVKVYCDVCGKEIKNQKEIWKVFLHSCEGNPRRSYNERFDDMCECCASMVSGCLDLLKTGKGVVIKLEGSERT